jgi:hypothetical protein
MKTPWFSFLFSFSLAFLFVITNCNSSLSIPQAAGEDISVETISAEQIAGNSCPPKLADNMCGGAKGYIKLAVEPVRGDTRRAIVKYMIPDCKNVTIKKVTLSIIENATKKKKITLLEKSKRLGSEKVKVIRGGKYYFQVKVLYSEPGLPFKEAEHNCVFDFK